MESPDALFQLARDADRVPHGLPLVAALTGFADAGAAVSQVSRYMLTTLPTRVVAEFDTDELLDYRARRPTMFFDQDHLASYTPQKLALYLVSDDVGQQFLLLTGFEPDFKWERFTAAVLGLADRFEVASMTWVHAIPMPVPHTRPMGVTVSGNREELIEAMSVWRPRTQVPTNALHLLEFRSQETGRPTSGFVVLVPHYLADTEHPDAAVKALEGISAATSIIFPTDKLKEEGREFVAKINAQVEANHELARLVGTLEERYDSYMEGNPLRSPLTDEDGELPTADEIAAELENFLAIRRSGEEERSREN